MDREKRSRIVAYKKFFQEPSQPAMLTIHERELIKHLHEQNPQEWDVKKLSESFPANEEAIKRVLRAKYQIKNEEQVKKMNARVERNWELLAQNKLEAPPELLEHWKKFADRRKNLTAQLENPEFHRLPTIEPKVKWKCGDMTRIISHYEKQIDQLYQKQIEGNAPKELSGGGEIAIRKSTLDARKAILERIEFDKTIQEKKKKESFVVGGDCDRFGENITFDQLEKQIQESARENKELSVFDKLILEKSGHNYEERDPLISESTFLEMDKNQRKHSFAEEIIHEKRKEKKEKGAFRERGERFEDEFQKPKKESKYQKAVAAWKKESVTYEPFKEENFRDVDEESLKGKAVRLTVEDISSALEFEEGNKPKFKVLEVVNEEEEPKEEKKKKKKKRAVKSLGAGDNLMKPEIELSPQAEKELDKMFYDKEVEEIEDTCFWNSKEGRKKKREQVPSVNNNQMPSKVEGEDYYPQKIEIPQEYVGSGLTFKVKDCYYDDDGEFLYRVPGMTK